MITNQKSGGLKMLRDGFSDMVGGMDSSRAPDLISEKHASLGVNVSFRGGKPKTRPAFIQRELNDSEGKDLLEDGRFLGGVAYYSSEVGRTILVGVYSGWLLSIDPISGDVAVLNPGDRNDLTRKHYLLQAENYIVVQNGVDIPLIWDGTGMARRSRTGANNNVLGTQNTTIVNVGGVATVTTQTAHGLSDGDYVQVEGTNRAGYVGQFYIYNVTEFTFDITVDSTLDDPTVFGDTRYVPEIPVGLIMAYGQGRIFLSASNRVELIAGDIIYGDEQGSVGNILNWTENQYLAEGLAFRLPANQGRIVAMAFPTFQDTSTGQGELFVFGEYGVSSYQVSAPRATISDLLTGAVVAAGWRDIQIQKIVLSGSGCTSQWSVVNFTNGDMLYRDLVGIRSYRNARGDLNSYGQTPISAELNRILETDVKTRLGNISATHFDDRALITCSPRFDVRLIRITSYEVSDGKTTITLADDHQVQVGSLVALDDIPGLNGTWEATAVTSTTIQLDTLPTEEVVIGPESHVISDDNGAEIFHKGIAVLDFNSTSTVGGKSSAAWDGVWTGIDTQQIVSGFFDGQIRCFSFVYGGIGQNQIWEITADDGDDRPVDSDPVLIECQLETRTFDFGNEFDKKRLRRLDLWLSDLRGQLDMEIFYKMDGRSCWTPWPPNWSRCATVSSLILPETNQNVDGLLQNRPQVRTQITQPMPPKICEETQGGFTNMGFEVQLRFVWSGKVTIDKAMIMADSVPESALARCPAGATETPTT